MKRKTSWQNVGKWYHDLVGREGSYYHREVILPALLPLLALRPGDSLLDVGCGQGILSRHLPEEMEYLGIDASPSLIAEANRMSSRRKHLFRVADAEKPFSAERKYSRATVILALQNMARPENVLKNIADCLLPEGQLLLVLNHPCFRMLKHSSWGTDKNVQYRRLDRYLTPYRTEVRSKPSEGAESPTTLSFHHSLSSLSRLLRDAGFSITLMEELCSNKKSYGKAARAENFARKEFPLFLILQCCKNK